MRVGGRGGTPVPARRGGTPSPRDFSDTRPAAAASLRSRAGARWGLVAVAVCAAVLLLAAGRLHEARAWPGVREDPPLLPPHTRVLVTGAAGFIALHTAEALLAAAEVDEVIGVDCYTDYYSLELKRARAARLRDAGARVVNASVCEQDAMSDLLREHAITHVVHLAGQPGVETSLEHPQLYVHVNVECFVSLLEAVRRQTSPPAVVFASSSSVYGHARPPFSESQEPRPSNVYGATKLQTETLARVYHGLYGIRSVGLRFFTVYGAFMRPDMAVYHFSSLLDKGGAVTLKGTDLARDFTHVADAVQGVVRALRYASAAGYTQPEMFNIASGATHTVVSLVHRLAALLGKPEAPLHMLPNAKHEMVATGASLAKARALLGYQPTMPLAAGLQDFVTWFAAHRTPAWDYTHRHDQHP